MRRRLASLIVSVAVSLVRWLLALAPRNFQSRFGPAILDDTRADLDAAARGGPLNAALAGRAAVADAARGVVAERIRPADSRASRRRLAGLATTLVTDVKLAWRSTTGRPALSLIVILTLGLAVGASTAMFSVADGVLLRPLPFPDSGRLVKLEEVTVGAARAGASLGAIDLWTREADALESVAWFEISQALVIVGDEPDRLAGGMVSKNYFDVLDVQPMLGRGFTPGPPFSGPDEVVISERLWRRLGGDASVLGRSITIDPRQPVVVGVMPAAFDHPAGAEFWTTPAKDMAMLANSRQVRFVNAIGRLRPGVPIERLEAQMAVLTERHPAVDRLGGEVRMRAAGLHDAAVAQVRPAIAVVVAAAGVLLLIASLNVAALLLARTASRVRERSVQAALGARRSRLVRQCALEVLLVALAGGALGILAAWTCRDLIVALSLDEVPMIGRVRIDVRALAFGFLATLTAATLAAVLPAALSARTDAAAGLRGSDRGGGAPPRVLRLLRTLVVAEVAMTLVLAIAGLLLARSLENLVRVDRGFTGDDVVAMRINVPIRPRVAREANVAFHEEVRRRAQQLPGIGAAAFASRLPLADALAAVEVRVAGAPAAGVQSIAQFASPGYLSTIGARLLEGRDIAETDRPVVPAAVVNDVLARHLFGEASALGRRIIFEFMTGPVEVEVVGVAQPVRYNGLAGAPAPELYVDYRARIMPMLLFAQANTPIDTTVTALKQIVREADPTGRVTVDQITTLGREVERRLARPRFFLALIGTFGVVALVLAAAGLYGVMTFAVSQRRHEMGVRLALGASPPELFRHVVAGGALLSGIGIVAGLAASAAATGVLRSLLFGVEPWDPATFLAATGLVAAVTITACCLPARRAQRTDPLVVLRTE